MGKRACIVHGWGGTPAAGWFRWLGEELTRHGFAVAIPAMPVTDEPRISRWVPALAEAVGRPDSETYLIGHSMGCQTIARYLATLPKGTTIGGAVFVAGFFRRLTGLSDDPADQATDQHWLGAPLDLAAVRSRLPRSVAIFSDNDPYVPLDNVEDYKEKLQSEIIIEHGKRHYSGSDGFTELPVARDAVLRLAQIG